MFCQEIVGAFEELKDLWDPKNRMNPGKPVRPAPILADLRLGTDYSPPRPRTFFHFRDDDGSFGHAAFRWVGVGECRRPDGGVMCPSHMVTREERRSTRKLVITEARRRHDPATGLALIDRTESAAAQGRRAPEGARS